MIQKIVIGIVLIVLGGLCANGQNEKPVYSIGTGIRLNNMPKTIRIASVTDFGISKNLNQYKIGVITQIYTDNAESLSGALKLTGGHFAYGRIIPTQKKWLSLEFKSDLNAQYIKSAWNSNTFVEEIQKYEEFEYILAEKLFDFSVGYGLRLNISRNFYVSQSFTGGVFYSQINSDELSLDAPEISDGEFDFRSYGNTGLQWNVALTFGYRFNRN